MLGPFRDGRSGYVFAVNPRGARYDSLITSGGFARVKRYRADKTAAEADTIDTVREIYRRSSGGVSRV